MKKLLALVVALVVLSAGCLGRGDMRGYGKLTPSLAGGVFITTKPAITGGYVSDIEVYYYFDWNDRYALPEKFVAYIVINNQTRTPCLTLLLERPLEEDHYYKITCNARVHGKVHTIQLVAIADNITVANETIWGESDG